MHFPSRLGLIAAVLFVFVSGAALAADPMSRKIGEPATFTGSSFGNLVTMTGDDDVVTATFDKGGKVLARGNLKNPTYAGFWTAETSPKRCGAERDGTTYWGKIMFDRSDAGRTYTGKWSYCDAEPDTAFQAKWDGN